MADLFGQAAAARHTKPALAKAVYIGKPSAVFWRFAHDFFP
jgi:hypothetical protein